jgi:hypothetical protein
MSWARFFSKTFTPSLDQNQGSVFPLQECDARIKLPPKESFLEKNVSGPNSCKTTKSTFFQSPHQFFPNFFTKVSIFHKTTFYVQTSHIF